MLARVRRLLGLPADDAPRASRWLAGVLVVVALAVAGAFLGANTDPTVAATAPAEREDADAAQPADPEVTVEPTEGRCGYVGRVIDAETGKPVEKFAIRIGWTDKPVTDAKDISWYSMIRDAASPGGRFSVRCTLQKTREQFVYFLILAEGYLPQLVSDKPLSGPFRHTGVVVRLKRGKSIVGRVLDQRKKGSGTFFRTLLSVFVSFWARFGQ